MMMPATIDTAWFTQSLLSPCCRGELTHEPAGAACRTCGATFATRPYGLDLVPADIAERHASYGGWTEVQKALAAWRARTWNQSEDAEAKTRETYRMAGEFLQMTGLGGRVLDVGCGSGWIASLIEARAGAYAGVDPMPLADTYPFPFARAVSDALPVDSGACDTVLFFSSLDYCLDLGATLREAYRVLTPGGRLAIASPIHATRETSGERLHCHRFLAGDLAREVERVFDAHVHVHEWRSNFHFVWTIRP